jgi:cell division protein FtsW
MSISPQTNDSHATGIIVVVACLMTFGLVMVASAGANLDRGVLQWRIWESAFGRQAIFTFAGFAAMLLVARGAHRAFHWREERWLQPCLVLFIVTLACLVAALAPGIGTVRNGARRWLQIGPADWGLSFQPSELAKLALVVLLAALLTGRRRYIRSFRDGILPACVAIGSCVVLVGVEDFGTAALLAGVGAAMLLVGGARIRHLLLLGLPGAAAMAYLMLCEPYRVERLTTFLNIWADPRGAGYHPVQSLVTIASGGMTGRGLGAGVQKFGYLPESRSDFIYAVICEETGMIGAVIIIALFVALVWLGWRVVANERVSLFGRMLAFGVTFMFGFQALINIAVVLVCAPTKGISLPMVSAGGSGVVFLGMAMGLLISAAREPEWESPALAPEGAAVAGVELA